MDLNHARLPIPPLRQVTVYCGAAGAALMEETATSILQGRPRVSNFGPGIRAGAMQAVHMARKAVSAKAKKERPRDEVSLMRTVAHDLSNALEAIMQASYLLSQANLSEDNRRWAQLIDTSSQEAARLNRELRKLLRALSEDES